MSASGINSDLIAEYVRLLRRSPVMPEAAASFLSEALPARDAARPCALVFSPHPDDECLTGALPLRLLQQGWQIINVAVTLGSKVERREGRKQELAKACAVLGFDCVLTAHDGFSGVSKTTREENAPAWQSMVARLAEMIAHVQPQAVFLPHAHDMHATHIGTHLLGMDALMQQGADFTCTVFQTEYWHPLAEPNLMVGLDVSAVEVLLSALACHVGEVSRNPYDARFPAYLIDNVRRGSEQVGSKGAAIAAFDFAMIYKVGLWLNGKFIPSALRRVSAPADFLAELF